MRPLLLIAILIAALVAYKFYSAGEEPASERQGPRSNGGAVAVDIYLAENQASENVVYASGSMVANEEVDLQSETAGRLVELNIREGSFVKKGAVIARIDAQDLKAQIRKIKFEQELAEQIEARQRKLLDIDAISKEEFDISVNDVNTLKVDLELLEVQLAKTEVRAPFSGYIGFKNVSIGAYLTPGIVIASLMQTNPIKLDFSIPEKYASRIGPGKEVTFAVDGTVEDFTATVRAVDPRVDEDLRTLRLRATTKNSDRALLPGMFARVEVPLGSEEAIMIPTEAIIPILKGKKVYVKRDGKVEGVEIVTGIRTDEKVQVQEGLTVGDSIIVSALMSLREGMSVKSKAVINQAR